MSPDSQWINLFPQTQKRTPKTWNFHVTVKAFLAKELSLPKRTRNEKQWERWRRRSFGSVHPWENENSNLAIVFNERTYAYTDGMYKAVCFIFLESTSSNRSWFSISFSHSFSLSLSLSLLIISRVHEAIRARFESHVCAIHACNLSRLCSLCVRAYILYLYISIYVRVRRKCQL